MGAQPPHSPGPWDLHSKRLRLLLELPRMRLAKTPRWPLFAPKNGRSEKFYHFLLTLLISAIGLLFQGRRKRKAAHTQKKKPP